MEGEACTTISVYENLSKNWRRPKDGPLQEAEALPFCECKGTTFTRNGKRKGQKNHMEHEKKHAGPRERGNRTLFIIRTRMGERRSERRRGKGTNAGAGGTGKGHFYSKSKTNDLCLFRLLDVESCRFCRNPQSVIRASICTNQLICIAFSSVLPFSSPSCFPFRLSIARHCIFGRLFSGRPDMPRHGGKRPCQRRCDFFPVLSMPQE